MMTEIPPELREAFERQAADIPDDYGAVMLPRIGARPRTVGPRALTLAAAATLAVVLAGSAVVLSDRHPAGHSAGTAARPPSSAPATSALELAGYRFALPADFIPVADRCLPDLGVPDVPLAPGESFAKSPQGGCIGAALVAGSALPPGARDVTVGGHAAHVVERPDGLVLLYVAVSAPSPRFVLLAARGLSTAQLITIASAGVR